MSVFDKKDKAKIIAQYFSSKFNDRFFSYDQEDGVVIRYPLTKDGKKIKVIEQSYNSPDQIRFYDKFYIVAFIYSPIACPWTAYNEIPFTLAQQKDAEDKPIKFDYLNKFHSNEFLVRLKRHLKLLNEATEMHRKRDLVAFDSAKLEVKIFYSYNTVTKIVSRCATLIFKAFNQHPERAIIIISDDNKFLAAIDEMEKEFQSRYYDSIVEREQIQRGQFLNKSEQELIKMVYF